jgi:hypothetical protein
MVSLFDDLLAKSFHEVDILSRFLHQHIEKDLAVYECVLRVTNHLLFDSIVKSCEIH